MRARESGTGTGAVVLLHGLPCSNRYWDGRYDQLAASGKRVIVPDLMGFGQELRETADYGFAGQAEQVRALLQERKISGPVVVGGHSFGALVALKLAGFYPDLVKGVVLFCPALYVDEASAARHVEHSGFMARLGLTNGHLAETVCEWHCRHRGIVAALMPLLLPTIPKAIAHDSAFHTWPAFHGALQSLITADAAALISAVHCPIDVIVGEDDKIVSASGVDKIVQPYKHEVTNVAYGDHHLPMKNVELCIKRLDRMWKLVG